MYLSFEKPKFMKTTILITAILCCTQVSAFVFPVKFVATVSETKPFTAAFSFIRGHKQGRFITVTWGMTNNSGVHHFNVESTYEDPYDPYSVWQPCGSMPCTNRPIFKITDAPVWPGTINYRVVAVMNDNTTITSVFYTTYIPG